MINSMIGLLLTLAAIGAGLMAGVYFAFSGFIMQSLDRLDSANAIDAMNAINEVILRSWFMPVFFGSTLLYVILAAMAVFDASLADRLMLFTAASIYVAGMFLCTVMFNVPLNNRLANAGKDGIAQQETWAHYLKYWTRFNHLRTICSLTASILSVLYLVNYT